MNKSILILFSSCLFLIQCRSKSSNPSILTLFIKTSVNPILKADSTLLFRDPVKKENVAWQKADVFNPAAIVKDNRIFVLYRCEDNPAAMLGGRTSRLGLASSEDGIHFSKFATPVLYPDNDEFKIYDYPGGCEDPRLVETEEGNYVVVYTSWNYKVPRLSVAFSKDLFHWQKKGPAFARAYSGKFLDSATKSASIITQKINNRWVAAKIDGKYWMYWGEHLINLAWSENLSDWNPLLDDSGQLLALARPRPGKFDSGLTECGPPAIMTDEGVILLYNGQNAPNGEADPKLPKGTYSVGRIVFSPKDLRSVISRADNCLLKPSLPHEISGQYKAGTTFAEGLVEFKNKWFLYYGTADSFVGLAISN
ncbi:MAG: glycoside hydrolase family 130 protein [Chitinophagales bacterium]